VTRRLRLHFRACHFAGLSPGFRRQERPRRDPRDLPVAGIGNRARPREPLPTTGKTNTISQAQPADEPAVPA